jgi:hypothetical protein
MELINATHAIIDQERTVTDQKLQLCPYKIEYHISGDLGITMNMVSELRG